MTAKPKPKTKEDTMKKEILPVMFRKFEDGQVICFFPSLCSSRKYILECDSYMHIGQHSTASISLITGLKNATEEEYADLLKEVAGIYDEYTLKVYSRYQYAFTRARYDDVKGKI
jgi:hypothetical protein